ncbi:MAG: 2-iminobutanoate/2-iminopropanoate deaminase [Candidatus Parcubacteria bacterium]|jgi:2-iminobutanoate/2-iminopropanoate deaminase
MKKVDTKNAPQAVGPYSQAVHSNGFVFCAGQIALHPETGLLTGADVRSQTEQVCKNLSAVLDAAGSSLVHVVKTEVYLQDMHDFAAMNEVYAQYFSGSVLPARVTVAVARLPKDALVEISCIAVTQ